jgi:hypothetical protein
MWSTLADFAEITVVHSNHGRQHGIPARGKWEGYVLRATWMPTEVACCKFWLPLTNAICPHWKAIAPHQTILPHSTHFLNFKMQA